MIGRVPQRARDREWTDQEVSMGQAHFDPAEKWAYGCPVTGEVGQIPGYQWAWRDRSLQASDERVTVDGLDHLICGLQVD